MSALLDATKEINEILANSAKANESMPAVLDKLSEVKVHGVVFPRIMLVELIGEFAEKISKHSEPDMQSSFDAAQRKWSDTLN
tara:strand:+ start:287 stop:535 length:249 start_codon:yes stop_codon:yes gene_type:complete